MRAGRRECQGRPGPAGRLVPGDRERLRFHVGTAQAGALVIRGPREAVDLPDGSALAILRLDGEVAAAPGDRFALRRPSPGSSAGGGVVLDALPPRGVSRRRLTPGRAVALATAVASLGSGVEGAAAEVAAARLDLHGALREPEGWRLAADIETALEETVLELVRAHHAAQPESPGAALPAVRTELAATGTTASHARTAPPRTRWPTSLVDRLVADGTLARDGDRLRDPARPAGLPAATLAAMDRLELALSVAAPPSLATAAREAGCPPAGIRALETAGRLVRLEDDLAWATGHVSRPRAPGAGDGCRGTALTRRLPRRDRNQPPVRAGDPRGPRSPRAPAPHGRRARPRPQDHRQAPGPRRGDGRRAGRAMGVAPDGAPDEVPGGEQGA